MPRGRTILTFGRLRGNVGALYAKTGVLAAQKRKNSEV
jgi:hypothetical protein